MTRAGEREVVKAEHVNGGAGYILKEALIAGDQLRTFFISKQNVTVRSSYSRVTFPTFLQRMFPFNLFGILVDDNDFIPTGTG